MKDDKWKLLKSNSVFSNKWLSILKNQYALSDKTIDDFYIIERADFVIIVALAGNDLLLVRQYRPATDKFYTALPAGYLEPGESPEDCARRELLEETGYTAGDCHLIAKFDPLPGYIKSAAHVVLCTATSKLNAVIDAKEIAEIIKVPFSQALAMIMRREIDEMQTVSAILIAKEYLPHNNTSNKK